MTKVEKTSHKVPCNLCGSSDYKLLFKSYDRLHKKPGIFNIVKCRKCGLIYIDPRPKNIGKYYPADYIPHNLPRVDFFESLFCRLMNSERYYKKDKNIFDQFLARVFDKIYNPIPYSHFGRILDLGCGSGINLYNLKKRGWDVYGLDISKNAVNFARNELNLKNVCVGTIESKKYPDSFFDVILLNHVIEHLSDPKRTLVEIKRVLKRGGLLLITTPNFNSFNAKLFKKFWFPLETPRHQYLFTPTTLRKLLDSVENLKVREIRYSVSTYSLGKSLGYLLGNKENINQTLMRLKILFLPLTFFLSLIRRADVLTLYVENKKVS